MARYVFLGPSLPLEQARELVDAEFLPPVQMGDLHDLVIGKAKPGDHIAIIDGLFERTPAVWHKEILFALSKGIHVYGASSMGALRAAELSVFGMKGYGTVFEAYSKGDIIDDDEVAVSHADAEFGFRCLSTAMISIRLRLAELLADDVIDTACAQLLLDKAKARNYAVRHWHDVVEWSREKLKQDRVDRLVEIGRLPDAKAQDAAGLLRHLQAMEESIEAFEPSFTFNQTSYWKGLQDSRPVKLRPNSLSAMANDSDQLEAVRHYRAAGVHRRAVFEAAVCNLVATRQPSERADRQSYQFALNEIAHRNDLTDKAAILAWKKAQKLDEAQWQALLELVIQRTKLSPYDNPDFDLCCLSAMKSSGLFGDFFARWQQAKVGKAVDHEVLQEWYEKRHGLMLPNPEAHAHNLGFSSLREFVSALEIVYRADELQH